MRDRIKRAAGELEKYRKNHDNQQFEKAVEHLEEVDVLSLKQIGEREAARRELLQAWCTVINLIDKVKDPKFDPDDAPLLNPLPPLDASGEIPPRSASAEAQKKYETAIAANEAKKLQRRTQFLVRQLEERALESTQRLLERLYTKSAADHKEIAAVFTAAKLPQARQAELMRPAK